MTDLLYNEPSFFSGMAAVADPHGTPVPYNQSPTPAIADARAARADWLALGRDFRAALIEFKSTLPR